MIEDILSYVSKNKKIFEIPSKERLTFVQIMHSRWKKYEKGRIIYAIFRQSLPTPILYAKISRDPSFDFALEQEWAWLVHLRRLNDPIINSIPTPLQLARIRDRMVLFESALPGITMLNLIDTLSIRNEADVHIYAEKLINLIEEWLCHFQNVTKQGIEIITESFIAQRVKPILQKYIEHVGSSNNSEETCSILLNKLKSYTGTALPIVIINGNLAPQTILVNDELTKIGIVDWKFCETTSLILREHYCFAQYLFYEWVQKGFLGNGDMEKIWAQTFIDIDNFLGKQLDLFIQRTNRRLGIEKGLADILFPIFLVNELNVQMEYNKFIPDPKMTHLEKFLELWIKAKFKY